MSATFTPVRLSTDRVTEAAGVMGRAAADDALFRYCLVNEAGRASKIASLMQTNLRICLAYGEVWTTPDSMNGVAAWLSPAHVVISQDDRDAAGWDEVKRAWGPEAIGRYHDFVTDVGELTTPGMHDPHWFLMWICVEPGCQGRGIGGTLIRSMASQVVADGLACHLRTVASRNVSIYERLGFRVTQDTILPRSGLRHWYMERPPVA